MKNSNYDYAVFIGRFQPFHIGHLFVFKEALQHAKKLIVLVGSSGGPRTLRNPFTFEERVEMMEQSLPAEIKQRIIVRPLQDFTYNDQAWVQSVTEIIENTVADKSKSIALVGHSKDETTYYLKLFPHWAYIEVGNLDKIHATEIRHHYFTGNPNTDFDSDILPKATINWLRRFAKRGEFHSLQCEYQHIDQFKSSWASTPYPVIFTATDALVRYGDEILLITRKNYPGKGLLALPGGFVEEDETLFDACMRELNEETQLAVTKPDLKEALVEHQVFDNPKRSSRGRVISYCYYFDLSKLAEKPEVTAADDAAVAEWINYQMIDRSQFFDDHFFIVQKLIKE